MDLQKAKLFAGWVMLAAVLYAAAVFSQWLALPGDFLAPVWLPVGFSLAAILLWGRRLWPGILFSLCGIYLLQGAPLWLAVRTAAVETTEVLLIAVITWRWINPQFHLSSMKDVARFFLATLLSCGLAAGVLALGLPNTFATRLAWGLSQVNGLLLVAPLVVSCFRPRTISWQLPVFFEMLALMGCTVGLGGVVFGGWLPIAFAVSLPYLLMLLQVWAALRFNPNITFHVTVVIAVVALLGTVSGQGAFAVLSPQPKLFALQSYLLVFGASGLFFGEVIPAWRLRLRRLEKAYADLEKREREYIEALEKSSADLLTLIENTDYSIWSMDCDLRVVTFNSHFASEFKSQFGFSLESGQDTLALLPVEIAAQWRAHYQRAMNGVSFSTDYPQEMQDGLHYFKVNFQPVQHGDAITGVVVFARDITETQYLFNELSASEARLRAIIEAAPFGAHSYELEPDRKLIFSGYNPAANRILGIDHAPLLGKTIEEAFPGLVDTPIPDTYRRIAADNERYDDEQVSYDEGQIQGAFEVHAFQTAPYRMTTFFRDITERKKAEVALRQSEAMLAKAQKIAHLGSYEMDFKTEQLRWSDEVFRIWGWDGDDAPTNDWLLSHIDPEDLPHVVKLFDEARSHSQSFGIDYRICRDSGDVRWLHDVAEVMADDAGNATKMFGTVLDITERMEAQEQIRQMNEELEQRVLQRTVELETANRQLATTNRELEAFSYTVSHDLRSPLRAIDGFSRILMDEYASELPDDAKRWFKIIRSNAQQMGHLIDDLLAFARIGRQTLNRSTVNMEDLVRLALVSLEADMAGRKVSIDIEPQLVCSGDPNLLLQVWTNLLSNALKFTRHSPVARIKIQAAISTHEIIYSVQDNGTGFDMQYADKLFGVFQRLQSEEKYEGTGVGLAMVERIVHKHGGRVWAEGQENQGATFYFALPV